MKKIVKGLFCSVVVLAAGVVRASVPSDGLAAAVADAADGAVIELDEGEYTISAELVVDRGITVKGAGIGKTILKGTQGAVRYLTITEGATVEGLTIKGKDIACKSVKGTGLNVSGTLKDCRVTGFKGMAYYQLGSVYVSGANALVTGCVIDGNQACYREDGGIDYGAGVYIVSGTVSDCVVSNNIAKGGAGIYMSGGLVERTKILNNRLVHNSGAAGSYSYYESKTVDSWGTGGGVYMTDGTLSECLVAGNKGTINSGVGGVYVSGKTAVIKNCVIRGNVSPGIRASLHPDLSYDNVAVEANVSGCHLPVEFGSDCNTDAVLFRDASHNDFTVIGEIAANRTEALTSDTVTLTSTVDGSASWAFTDQSGQVIEAEGMEVSRTFPAGVYDIKLTVGGVDYECKSALRIGAVKYSVSSDEELASALKLAQDGSTIELADGSYTVSSRMTLTNAVTLTGSHYTNCTIALKSTVYDRLLIVANQDALVRGITLSGGRLSHYGKSGTPAINGVGVWINSAGGTITRCRMTGAKPNSHYQCGGVAIQNSRGKITHSIIDGNDLTTGGNTSCCGGVYVNGTLDNCLVCNNKANNRGGIGVNSSARVYNCTIVNNTASSSGSGVWIFNTGARLVNCLIGSNPSDGQTQYSSYSACFQNCAFVGTGAYGTDCVTLSDPYVGFATKDYHIVPGSAGAAERGIVYDNMSETDLDGNPRIQGELPDAGCYEAEANKFGCGTDADTGATSGDTRICFVGTTVCFSSSVDNAPDGATLVYAWTFTDRLGNVTQSSEQNPQLALPAGWYTVDLTVSVVGDPAKTAVAATRVDYVHVCPKDLYAVADNEQETYPWDSPANGTSNVLDLVEEALNGTTIHIGVGEFVIKKEMVLSKRLTVTGEGWEKSVIRMSPNANYRVLRINNRASVVERVTLAGGRCAIYNGRDGD